jgi:L-seryl-tRNA(Ser) seleniumtransferase
MPFLYVRNRYMPEKELLRKIPKVDAILKHYDWKKLVATYPEDLSKDVLREILDALRREIRTGEASSIPPISEIVLITEKGLIASTNPRLKRVVNGTGVIIHTNLGRSLLAKSAIEAVMNAAAHYTNLEYDLHKGTRGDRYDHSTAILTRLTGAESALVVNNNAAAVILILNTFADGKEVVVSRGELVEIGGSFRVPDVMKKSGALLREVGTTNRTYKEDYERAIQEDTGLLMKAHTSNFTIKGFTHETSIEELVILGKQYGIPTYYDAGSGLMFPVHDRVFSDEPCIPVELAKGLDIISFSGDKLPGAPQAGIILGKKTYIDMMKKNPLTRALRPDKFTLAGLESTLLLYLDRETAIREIPTLRMIHENKVSLKKEAQKIARALRTRCSTISVTVVPLGSEVGGGTLPDVVIPSYGVSLKPHLMSLEKFETRLRSLKVPIIGRIEKNMFLIDMRTLLKDDRDLLISGIETVLGDGE